MRFSTRCFALIVMAAGIPAAAEDLTVVSKQTRNDAAPTAETSYFGGSKMRLARGDEGDFIMDYASATMTMIDNKKKEYSVMTKEDMEALAAQMKEMQAQMQARMANMPPEMKEKMAGMMGGVAQSINVQKGTGGRTIAGYACENWIVTMGQMTRQEHCVTTQVQFPAAAFDGMRAFSQSMSAAMGPMAKGMSGTWDKFKEMKGFPLSTTMTMTIMGKTITTSTEVTEIRKGAIPESAFAVPAGYKKVDSPMAKALQKHPK